MRGRRVAVVATIALIAAACGGDEGADADADVEVEVRDGMALPPSAQAPRANLPGRSPDTVRPALDSLDVVDGAEEFGVREGRRRSPEELDLGAIVSTYREHYRDEFVERGSDVQGRVDPELVEAAKRRVALEWGYVEVGAWSDMLRDMTADQRAVLANRLAAANETLAAAYHGPDAPVPPE